MSFLTLQHKYITEFYERCLKEYLNFPPVLDEETWLTCIFILLTRGLNIRGRAICIGNILPLSTLFILAEMTSMECKGL